MKKILFALLVFLFPLNAVAITTPSEGIWIEPKEAKAGENITLNILVYNDSEKTANVIVSFFETDTLIDDSGVLVIPPKTAKTSTVLWVMPKESKVVTAKIKSALDTTKKPIPNMTGVLATTSIGGAQNIKLPKLSGIKVFFQKNIDKLEIFRVRQLDNFSEMKAKYQVAVEANKSTDVNKMLEPTPSGGSDVIESEKIEVNMLDYVKLVYASIGKGLFEHKSYFYIAVSLLTLLILRFIFSRFF